jgi:serine/threonine protein phosphatase 1
MISRLFQKKPVAAPVRAPLTPAAPEGLVVWAVGDIHGRLDLLEPLVEAIIADAAASTPDRTMAIFLGDYIDRGPASAEVIRYLAGLSNEAGVEWRFLKGNHEEAMLNFLKDPAFGVEWCQYGGGATLRSYGLREPDIKHRVEAWRGLALDLDHRIPAAERAFLDNLELSLAVGDYFFAHAGARPGKTLAEQTAHDLMWVRRSFLDSPEVFEKVVVHGHTPADAVHIDHRRIGLDTRAYESGMLSAARLAGTGRAVIQAISADGIVRVVPTAT